jgi:hypothetical protein
MSTTTKRLPGSTDTCTVCGYTIRWTGRSWQHDGTYRHKAQPIGEAPLFVLVMEPGGVRFAFHANDQAHANQLAGNWNRYHSFHILPEADRGKARPVTDQERTWVSVQDSWVRGR